MPKPVRKKKHFIRKKESTTYKLIPGYVESDEEEQPQEQELEDRKTEQREHGIYFDDNYNYMKHLRSVTEPATMVSTQAEDDDTRSQTTSRMPGPFMLFSTDETEEAHIDPEVLAALEDAPVVPLETLDSEGEGEEGEDLLNDDFIDLAGGVVEKERLGEEEEEEGNDREFDFDDEDIDTCSGSEFSGNVSDMSDELDDARVPRVGRGTAEDDLIEAQTAQILRNFEQGLGLGMSSLEVIDQEMPSAEDYTHIQHMMAQTPARDAVKSWSEVLDDRSERAPVDSSMYIYEDEDEFEWREVAPAQPAFDAVSILSLRSNTRNLPTDIIPPKKTKGSVAPSEADSEPAVVLGLSLRQLEEEMRASRRADKASTFRPQDETAEEKRLRKKAVKDERKERRQEKKANKMVFSIENQKMKKEVANLSRAGKAVAL